MSSFINQIAPHAKRIQHNYQILASIIIAQAILESNWGKSGLAINAYNLFGIKGSFNGQSVTMQTAEYNRDGERSSITAKFKKYPSWYESFEDLAKLYTNGVSWDRNKYKKIIGEKDYMKVARELQSSGYATDPKYADKLISLIKRYELTKYDQSTDSINHKIYPGHLIKRNARGAYVRDIQKVVGTKVDGIFGPLTEAAVKDFQKKNSLVVDGIVGPKTWRKLFN